MFPTSYQGYTPASASQFIDIKIGSNHSKVGPISRASNKTQNQTTKPSTFSNQSNQPNQLNQSQKDFSNLPKALQLFYNRKPESSYSSTFQSSNDTLKNTQDLRRKNEKQKSNTVMPLEFSKTSYQDTFSNESIKGAERWRNVNPEKKKLQLSQNRIRFSSSFDKTTSQEEFSSPLNKIHLAMNPTAKSGEKTSGHVTSYTGHIPKHEPNREKAFNTNKSIDSKRAGARDSMRFAVNINLPGYSGFQPTSSKNLRQNPYSYNGKTTSTIDYSPKTVDGNITKDFGNFSTTTHQFFTLAANTSSDGLADAQKFYANYRPLGGLPSIGAKSERDWISDSALRRTHIY